MSSHPQQALNHNENRSKVCVVCFEKSKYKITDVIVSRIRSYFIENYDVDDESVPCGICSKCRRDLMDVSNSVKSVDILPEPYNFDSIFAYTRATRSDPSPICLCAICEIARLKSVPSRKKGRPSSELAPICLPVTICSYCKSVIGRGLHHKCNKTSLRENVVAICSSSDRKSQEFVCTSIIRNHTENYSTSSLSLYSGGPNPLEISIREATGHTNQVKIEDLSNLQSVLSASNNEMKRKIIPFIRTVFGKHSVRSFVSVQLSQRDHCLEKFFGKVNHEFESSDDQCINSPLIYCSDINGLVEFLCQKRGLNADTASFKIGIDGGGGFLKVCLNIYENNSSEMDAHRCGLLKKGTSNTSVKKLIILAIAPKVKETYGNLRFILNMLNIKEVDFVFFTAVDLKMGNILAGIQSHSSTHPCMYCECPKHEFQNPLKSKSYIMRTIADIKRFSAEYEAKAKIYNPKAPAKDYKNCVAPPIVSGSDQTMIIQAMPPPELHLLLRITNKLFNELEKDFPVIAQSWMKQIGLCRPEMHGGEFAGNDCRQMIKNVFVLSNLAANQINSSEKLKAIIQSFQLFDVVVQKCFGKNLNEGFVDSINEFHTTYLLTNCSVTTAIHILCTHVIQFCQLVKCGLGSFSEQASEAVHSDFQKLWQSSGKINFNNENFSALLLSSVIRYNSRHL